MKRKKLTETTKKYFFISFLFSTVLVVSLPHSVFSSTTTHQPTKKQVVDKLIELKEKRHKKIKELDAELAKELNKSNQIKLDDKADNIDNSDFFAISDTLKFISEKRKEKLLEIDFFNQLILRVDTRYSSPPLKEFLQQTFLKMAQDNILEKSRPENSSSDQDTDKNYATFLTYLSICMRELLEPSEDPLDLIDSYLEFSKISDPKTPNEFKSERKYL